MEMKFWDVQAEEEPENETEKTEINVGPGKNGIFEVKRRTKFNNQECSRCKCCKEVKLEED